MEEDWRLALDARTTKCNICDDTAKFIVQLELIRKRDSCYRLLHDHEIPFHRCMQHEYLYEKMGANVELKDYFTETIRENQ